MLITGTIASLVARILTYSKEVLADSPVGYWKLDETSGTNAVDQINGNDGTYAGGFTLNQAALINAGSCIDLDGTNSTQITIGAASELEILGDMTIEVWCNLDSLANPAYLCAWWGSGETEANNFIWSFRINTGGTMACFWENGAGSNNTVTSSNEVGIVANHHLVCVRDTSANTVTFYDNGVEYDTVAYTNDPTGGSTGGAYIGRNLNDAFSVNGRLDEVAIYNTKLSATRIEEHFIAGGGTIGDPFFGNVVLLVRSVDATNGQTTFTDESSAARTLTRNGDTIYDNTQTKFGSAASILFDGSGDDWVEMPDDPDLGLEDRTVDFCLEAWVYVTDDTSHSGIFVGRDNSSSEEFTFYTKANVGTPGLVGLQLVIWNPNTIVGVDEIMTIDAWHHVAATRTENGGDGDLVLYVDGVSVATVTQTANGATNTGVYYIGHNAFNSGRDFTGHIDSLRLTRNNARYTGNFTPPASPFPAS